MIRAPSSSADPLWPRAHLKDVVIFRSGSRNTDTAVVGGDFPFFVCSKEILCCDRYDFDCEAVIMAGNNADGIFHLHHFAGKFAARQRTYVITPSSKLLTCRWLFHQLSLLQPQFQESAIGTTTRYVTIGMLRGAEIFLPAAEAQRAVCDAVGDADALLGGLDRLITKKRDLKQAAIQQLLTGQTRLPGFHGKWETIYFADLGDKCKPWSIVGGPFGSNLKASDYTREGVRIIQLQNIGDGRFWDDYAIYTSEAKADELLSNNIYPGEIILSKMGDPVARACLVPTTNRRYLMASDGIRLAVDPLQFNTRFVLEYINSPYFRRRAIEASTGSTRQRIGMDELKHLQFVKPALAEQTAIATVLSDMDAELQALAARRDKTHDLKQAMMQELLTGKTRLVPADVAHA